jgi:hypothetical protein
MSTASPVASPRPADSARPKVKADDVIRERIAEACSALWWAELTRASLRIVIVWLIALLLWLVVDQWVYSPGVLLRVVALVALLTWTVRRVLLVVWPIMRSSIRPEYAARSLERDNPQLHQDLTSYVTLQSDRANDGLASRVLRSIGSTAARQLRVHDQLPGEATGTLRWWVAAASALALLATYAVLSPKNSFQSASRLIAPIASIDPAKRVQIRDVLPGDAEAVAGRPVIVSARISGMSRGDVAHVRWQTGSAERESSLEADPDSPRRTGEIDLPHSVSGTVDYFIEAGDATAGPFHLRVQDVPVVAVQSVRYQPPSYTGEVPHTSSSGAISAVDGTRVTLRATTNRAVTKAKIEFNPKPLGDSIRATAGATELEIGADGTVLTVSFPLRSAKGRSAAVELESYRVKVWDAAGQGNPEPIIYPIEVIADLPPEVSIVMPRQSPKEVPINAQQVIEVHSLDADYGLKRVALEMRIGLAVIDEPVLWSDPQGASGNRVCEYRFRPSQLGLQVGDTVQVRAIAMDNRGSDEDQAIEPNVTRTDPIQLVVVAVAPLPEDDAGGDGLSPPDDRPASDESPPDQDGSEQGESQQSGGGGESGQQEGGGSGSESGEQGEGGQGQGGQGEGGQGQASSDANTSTGGENSAGESPSENQSGGGESSGGESSGGDASADPGQDPSDASSDPAGSGDDASSGGTEAGSTNDNQPPGGEGQPDAAAQSSDAAAAGSTDNAGSESSSAGRDSASGQSPDGQPSPSGQGQGQPKPPQHDGEAMERIRDYLNEKNNQSNQQNSGQSSSSQNSAGDSSSSSDSPRSPGGQSGQRGADAQQPQPDNGSSSPSPSDPGGQSQTGGQSKTGGDENRDPAGGANAKDGGADPQDGGDGARSDDSGSTAESSGDPQQDAGEPAGSGQSDSGDQAEPGQSPRSDGSPSDDGSNSPEGPAGDSQSPGQQGKTPQGAGGDDASEAGDAGSESGDSPGGEQGEGSSTESGTEGQSGGENGPSENNSQASDSGKGDPSGQEQTDSDGSSASGSSNSDPSDPASAADDSQSPDNFSGSGSGGEGTAKAGDAPTPPDPVDLEYAKEATDMVLEYLDQTRDAPDRELLEELNWSEQDLKRFAQRWNNVRSMQQSAQPGANRDIEEALKSLGMRKPTEATQNRREAADELRGVRDSGNRRPVPAAHRDAFEAFRRAIGKQR